MQQVGILYDDIFIQHRTGSHPENEERLRATLRILRQIDYWGDGRAPWITHLSPRQATVAEIQWCHSPALISLAKERCEEAHKTSHQLFLDSFNSRYGETVASPKSYDAALHAAGGMFTAIDAIMKKQVVRAFNLCRPPGHHSDYAHARGFCYFNNIALAVNYLHKQHGLKKVAIFDFDAHAGNGTEDLINQGHVPAETLMISIHQHPDTLYTGTCYIGDIGIREHRGKIANITLAPNSGHESIQAAFSSVVLPLLHEFQPEFILISAGYDAHHNDQLTNLHFMEQSYTYMTEQLVAVADQYAHSRMLCTLEGGYNLTALGNSIANTIAAMGDAVPPFAEPSIIADRPDIFAFTTDTVIPQVR
ncbi:MAG: histone deacetylase, partial [Promethearchaeota archaeon]